MWQELNTGAEPSEESNLQNEFSGWGDCFDATQRDCVEEIETSSISSSTCVLDGESPGSTRTWQASKLAMECNDDSIQEFDRISTSEACIHVQSKDSPQELYSVICGVSRSPKATSTTSNSRSVYRRNTALLIDTLDRLLVDPLKGHGAVPSATKPRGGARSKPRARNVVLREAAVLIWRLLCDEEVRPRYAIAEGSSLSCAFGKNAV